MSQSNIHIFQQNKLNKDITLTKIKIVFMLKRQGIFQMQIIFPEGLIIVIQ